MKTTEITAGRAYRNRPDGKTTRRVMGIGSDLPIDYGNPREGDELAVVCVDQTGRLMCMRLNSFAKWAKCEVPCEAD